MKYYYKKPNEWIGAGEVYICNHPLYNRCTLFRIGIRGIAIIQEKFDEKTKVRWWGPIEPWLAGDIYFSDKFREFFEANALGPDDHGLYPTFTVRQIMWKLRMKPLRKEFWEEDIQLLR